MTRVPWDKTEYFINEEEKVVWLRGSFMRAMALHHRQGDPVPGYQIKLCTPKELERMKDAEKE